MDGDPDHVSVTALTITHVVTLKFKEENYLLWKLQFEQFLSSQTLLGYITGAQPRSAPTITLRKGDQANEAVSPEYLKWMQKDQFIFAWIYGKLTEDALNLVYGLHTSQDVLLALAKK